MYEAEYESVFDSFKGMSRPWAEIVGAEKYALAIYRLQNEVGLTFREARALLTPIEGIKNLIVEWGCPFKDIYDLMEKGQAKLDKHTGGDHWKNEELAPTLMQHIF